MGVNAIYPTQTGAYCAAVDVCLATGRSRHPRCPFGMRGAACRCHEAREEIRSARYFEGIPASIQVRPWPVTETSLCRSMVFGVANTVVCGT